MSRWKRIASGLVWCGCCWLAAAGQTPVRNTPEFFRADLALLKGESRQASQFPPSHFDAGSRLLAQVSGSESSDADLDSEPDATPLQQGGHVNLTPLIGSAARPEAPQVDPEHYHWAGLFAESFAFFGVENSFRLMTDPYFRHLTADAPFWHNYIASLKQWNFGRWDDGDDFLVAYVGHPMQGSITEFIEIQNDPHARYLRIDDGRAYWKSRAQSLLWNTLYSTDQKLGPLGEAALGGEGGYTYVIGCPYPCPTYNPAIDKVTNNTGWVKLVSTPVVGTLWTLTEDLIDRYVSDRLQAGRPQALFPKIFRGAINPSRTMANGLRGKNPWYRDYQHEYAPERSSPYGNFLREEEGANSVGRFEVFPHLTVLSLPVNTGRCIACRQSLIGSGIGFSTRLSWWADLDSDLSYVPSASQLPSDRAGGSAVSGTFGLRTGFTRAHYGIKAFVRPGFLSYSQAYESSPSGGNPAPRLGRITHMAAVLGIDADVSISRHVALRGALTNTAVRYREGYLLPPTPGREPYLQFLSRQVFLTNENWGFQTGTVLRF
jgi:hypothetical protein